MTLDRQRGCLIGLAVGDALGAAIEFRAPGTFKPLTGYRSGGPHGFRHRQPPQIKGSGYVVRSLEAAIWAFHNATDFREAMLRAVNLGNDSDTTGAVCGQFAGAYWGESGIPEEWRDELARTDMIEKALTGLLFETPSEGSQT